MSKYIIKNCPAIYGIDDGFLCSAGEDYESEKYCYDCTDCKIKQIVDYCLDNEKYGDGYYTRPILEKLDIQEIE